MGLSRNEWRLVAATAVLAILGVGLFMLVRNERITPGSDAREAPHAAPPSAPAGGPVTPPIAIDQGPAPAAVRAGGNAAPGAGDERRAVLASLRESGPANEVWEGQAIAVLRSFGHGAVATSATDCFVAGCGATFTFGSDASYRHNVMELQASDPYQTWTGGKRFTTPEVGPDGRIVVALVLYRPD